MKDSSKDARSSMAPKRSSGRSRSDDKSLEEVRLEHKAKGHDKSLPSPVSEGGIDSKRNRDPKESAEKRGLQKGFGKQQAKEGLDRKVPHNHASGADRAAGGLH